MFDDKLASTSSSIAQRRLAAGGLGLVALLAVHVSVARAGIADSRPNIVLVVSDDQGYGDLGRHGNPLVRTPNLDRMYDQSVRFADFHVSPTCAPTRASLMTGRHEFKNGVTHTIRERERLNLQATTIAQVLKAASEATADRPGLLVNVAVGYGGRREIADAVRSLLQEHATKGTTIEELAEILDVEHIAEHLYTAGQPDPDLVIRTSGEQRLGGFLLWQSTHSEFYFCDAYWPAFRRVDFLRALRSYGARHRRFGA